MGEPYRTPSVRESCRKVISRIRGFSADASGSEKYRQR
jgi:hypothetical protein